MPGRMEPIFPSKHSVPASEGLRAGPLETGYKSKTLEYFLMQFVLFEHQCLPNRRVRGRSERSYNIHEGNGREAFLGLRCKPTVEI